MDGMQLAETKLNILSWDLQQVWKLRSKRKK